MALTLYTAFFTQVCSLVDDPRIIKRTGAKIGVAGVIWPSILFPGDHLPPANPDGGGASFQGDETTTLSLAAELPKVFFHPAQQSTLQEILQLLQDRPSSNAALFQFRDALRSLLETAPNDNEDTLEFKAATGNTATPDEDWLRILDVFSVVPTGNIPDSGGGAASFGDVFGRLWNGAVNALRVGTYWQMKSRAGTVGRQGLGPLLGKIYQAVPNLNIHLLGHSFGARLVSYSLTGLPTTTPSPVKSLVLLQGAFSHFAFSESLPFDTARKGDLAGMASRVDGPLLATHSLFDLAVGSAYPAASIISGEDAADATDLLYRWEGMGHDGAQAVNAQESGLSGPGTAYPFAKGKWINLDGNQIIKNGGPPSGAHSDIIHPETAWAVLAAAKLVIPMGANSQSAKYCHRK